MARGGEPPAERGAHLILTLQKSVRAVLVEYGGAKNETVRDPARHDGSPAVFDRQESSCGGGSDDVSAFRTAAKDSSPTSMRGWKRNIIIA